MEGDLRKPQVSLLKKYDIPIEHLTYEHLEKCSNKKELERIIRILRSGEEGSYPDLLKLAEKQLRLIAPDSRVLRVEAPVLTKDSLTKEEWDAVEKELKLWEEEMNIMDKSLDFEKGRIEVVGNKSMPEVRKVVQPSKSKNQNLQKIPARNKTLTENSQRIKSGDYAAWDKFDVDKELLKIDVEEERKQEENEKKKREAKKLEKGKKIEIASVNRENYSSMEQQILANQAKDRGNECYKSEDLESALKYYEISIKLYPTANAINNRAMTYLKLKQYENVIKDTNKVLHLEKNNIKALHRRATAYQNMHKDGDNTYYEQLALQDLCKIVQLEPNNKTAQADLQKLKKKLNIEETGKKFRMTISEELINEGNSNQNEGKNITNKTKDECNISTDKLPLTYYGPSTSTFQCEPHSIAHRAISGSSIPGQVLCKCNSNRLRQNPLCQKCGEAMCTPKPIKDAHTKTGTEPHSKKISEMKNELLEQQTNKTKNNDVLKSKPLPEINEKNHLQPDIKYATAESNKKNSNNNDANNINELNTNNSTDNSKKVVVISKSGITSSKVDLNNLKKKDEIKKPMECQNEKTLINDQTKSINNEKSVKNVEFIGSKYNETIIPENSSSQSDVKNGSKKSKNKKKKSKDHKENKTLRKHLESFKMEPVKVVHAAKYLHPTSVEPKITNGTAAEIRREPNFSNNIQYKAFVPNRKCCSIGYRSMDSSATRIQSLEARKAFSAENDKNNDLSLEGNKENILENIACNVENEEKENSAEEIKKELFESSYEFTKKWEEFKKFDESYCKRAEIIRKIKPHDLSKVIGIKLDSDMLSCLLECLLRHFVEKEPKRVMELLKELTQVPRFGLVSMFLADTDKNKIKKLIETAEDKGFKLDEDIKKTLMMLS